MGSLVQNHTVVDNGTPIDVDVIVPKAEPAHEGSSSSVSTPEAEGEALPQDVVQTQKRKGGRKPVCGTRRPAGIGGDTPFAHLCYQSLDICDLRRAQTTEQTSAGGLPGTKNGVHQTTRDDH